MMNFNQKNELRYRFEMPLPSKLIQADTKYEVKTNLQVIGTELNLLLQLLYFSLKLTNSKKTHELNLFLIKAQNRMI